MNKKEAILKAAQEAFGQFGYSGATVKDVAGRAGVSFGLVSHYFGNKHDLFLAAGFDMADRLIERLSAASMDKETGLEAVKCYMAAYFQFTEEHRTGFPVLLRCSPFSHMEPGVDGAKVAEKFSIFIDELKRCVVQGIDDGSIRKLPVEVTALIIYGNIIGAVRTSVLSPYKAENIFGETIDLVMRSLTDDNQEAIFNSTDIRMAELQAS